MRSVILSIDYGLQQITLEDNVTVTAGWGIYQRDTAGQDFPNGLRNIVDDIQQRIARMRRESGRL